MKRTKRNRNKGIIENSYAKRRTALDCTVQTYALNVDSQRFDERIYVQNCIRRQISSKQPTNFCR